MPAVIDLDTEEFSEVSEQEAFKLQLAGTHQLVHKSSHWAYWYSRDVLNGPFPEGEMAIATHPLYSLWYSMYVIKKRFLAGEDTILENRGICNMYNQHFNLRLVHRKVFVS